MSDPAVPPRPEPAPMDSNPETGHAYLAPAPEQRPSLRSKLLKALAVVVAVVVVLVLKNTVFGDEARGAEVGDCVVANQTSDGTDVKIVDCASGDAAYDVVAKVPGTSDPQSKACDQYFTEGEAFSVYVSKTGSGEFLLCLRPRS